MLNYVTRVLVGKASGAVNSGSVPNSLAKGDIIMVDGITGAAITTAVAAAAATSVRFINGGRNGSPIASSLIERANITKVTKQVYAAAVAQTETYASLTMVAGKEYKFVIVFKDDQRLIANRQTRVIITHTTPATGFTLATEVTKLVAKINASKQLKGLLVGSIATADVVLTGQAIPTRSINDYQYVNFTSSFVNVTDDTYVNAGTVVAPTPGSGLPAQVIAMERMALGHLGFTDLRDFRTNKDVPFMATEDVIGSGYNIYHIQHFDAHTGDLQSTMRSPLQTTLAIAAASAQATAVEALLEAFVLADGDGTTVDPE